MDAVRTFIIYVLCVADKNVLSTDSSHTYSYIAGSLLAVRRPLFVCCMNNVDEFASSRNKISGR